MTEEITGEGAEPKQDSSKNQEAAMARIREQRDSLKKENESLKVTQTGEFNKDTFKAEVLEEVKRDSEISRFVKKNPDFAEHENTVRDLFSSKKVSGSIDADSVFYMAAGKDLLKIGSKIKKEADAKAKEETSGGSSTKGGEKTDFKSLSTEDIIKMRDEALRKR